MKNDPLDVLKYPCCELKKRMRNQFCVILATRDGISLFHVFQERLTEIKYIYAKMMRLQPQFVH